MRLAALAFVFIGMCANATDLSEAEKKKVVDNVSHEYTTCSAYYTTAAAAASLSGDEEKAAELLKASSAAMTKAGITAQIGRSREMAVKVVTARYDIQSKRMSSEIEDDVSNISILTSKYQDRCASILNEIDALIKEWTEIIKARR